jgi:drug/metabolite transporter (DMT)-like permease
MYGLIVLVTVLTLSGQICLKKGLLEANSGGLIAAHEYLRAIISFLTNVYVLIGVLCAAIGAVLWLLVISRAELSFVFPISGGLFYVLLFLFSKYFLGESVSPYRWGGMVAIFLGILLIVKK